MSGLPRQVEQQLKEVEEIERQLAGQKEEPEVETPQPEAEVAEPAPQEQAPQPQPEVKQDTEATWEQRFKTLQGMFRAELQREVANQMREAQATITQLQEQLSQPKKPEAPQDQKLVTDEDVENFGGDLIDTMRRAAREEVQREMGQAIRKLEAENAQLRAAMQQTTAQVSNMTFEQQLALAVPDFAQVNNDPRWFAWLDEYDPMLRAPRRAAAEAAFNADDVPGVKHYVELFKQSLNTAQPQVDKRQEELSRQVAPSRTAGSATPTVNTPRVYTAQEASKAFDRVRDLNISGKYDEASKLEAEISAAYMEGRVR